MSTDNLHPSDLKEALSVTPLLHLIPKQDIAPLISSAAIDTITEDMNLMNTNSASNAMKIRETLSQDPQHFKEMVNFLCKNFEEFEDQELNDLVFKKPVISVDEKKLDDDSIDLLPLEKRLFDSMGDIADSSIKELQVQFDPAEFDGSRLSVRKKYNIEDMSAIQNHNELYQKKFQKEYNISIKNSQPKNMNLNSISYDNKRPLDSLLNSEEIYSKRPNKLSILMHNEIVEGAYSGLIALIDEIGLVDEDSINEHMKWVIKDECKILATSTLLSLYDYLLRIINDPVIEKVDIEYLLRIQNLCFKSINIGTDMNWNELIDLICINDNKIKLKNLPQIQFIFDQAFNCLIAAKIMTLIFNGKRTDKRLFLDCYLISVINLISSLVQDAIIPFVGKTSNNTDEIASLKSTYSTIITDIGHIFNQVSLHTQNNEMDEQLLTRLEYLSLSIIFADGFIKEKSSLLSVNNFENLKVDSCNILISIFKGHIDQRQFILNEILSSFDKLPPLRLAARQYKLARGGNVQLVSILLVYLLQSFDINNYASEADKAINSHSIDDNSKITIQSKRKLIIEASNALYQQSIQISNDIASFLFVKLRNNSGQQHKHSFELLLEDLLILLQFPEWPGAEIMIISIMKAFLFSIQNGNESALFETYALEFSGMIGLKILQLKKNTDSTHQLNANSTIDDIKIFKKCFIDTFQYTQLQKNKNKAYISSFRFLILKYISLLTPLLMESTGTQHQSQLEALNSDPDDVHQVASVSEDANKLFDYLLTVVSEDSVKLNQALNSDTDLISINSYANILLSQDLLTLYDNFFNVVINSLDSNKIKTKTRAIKILSSILDKDSSLLISQRVQEHISQRLSDSSPLVRDAVIDLISRYVNSKPEVIDQFHMPICDHLNDESVQVRKRVIKIAKKMYLNTDKRSVKSKIVMKILRRLDDEDDTIQDLAKSYLLNLWFISLIEETKDKEIATVTSLTLKRSEIMMDIVSTGGKICMYFETFLTDYVLYNENKLVRDAVYLLIDKTLDFAIDCTETKFQLQVDKSLQLIATFVKCDGKLLSQDQLVSLQPYIIDKRNAGEVVSFYSLVIFKNVLPEFNSLRPDFLGSTQSYLLRHLTKFNVKELHEAMPCVWKLCQMKNETNKLANASISCMKLIKPYIDQHKNKEGAKPDLRLQKLLHLLGSLGTYCKFEKHRDLFLKSTVGLKEKETITSLIMKFLLYFCGIRFNSSVRNTAIQNVMHICTSHPKLFISEPILKVLDREFEGSDIIIKHSMIQGIMEFLKKEDNEAQKRNGVQERSSKNTKLDIAVFHGNSQIYVNDGICAGIIQRYIEKILELCIYDAGNFSILPIQFLQLIIKLGFANPKLCIPTIIALESSTNPYIKNISIELHKELFEKHESLIVTSYYEGIKLAIKYRKKTSENFYDERFFIKNLYSFVRGAYSSKKKFIQSIVKLFNVNLASQNLEENIFQRDSIIFTSFNMSVVNFTSLEEVLLFIYNLDKAISRVGMDLLDRLKEENVSLSLTDKQNLCINTQTLIAIVNLRNHLLSSYSINYNQLDSFNPSKVDIELRQLPKIIHLYPLNLDDIELHVDLQNPDSFEVVFARYFQLIHEFTQ